MPLDDWTTTPGIPNATVGRVTSADRLRPVPASPVGMPPGDTWLSDAELVILVAEQVGTFEKRIELNNFEVPMPPDDAEPQATPFWQ